MDALGHTGRALGRHGEEVVVSRQQDTRIGRQLHGDLAILVLKVLKRDATLVTVDRVGNGSHADDGEGFGFAGDGEGKRVSPGADRLLSEVRDNRASGLGAVGVEEVGRGEDLAVGMVDARVALGGRAANGGDVAESAAAAEDCAIGHEDRHGVVVARDGLGSELGPFLGRGVEELGFQNGGGVGEDDGAALATGHKDGAVGQDDRVGEAARSSHVGNALDLGRLISLADGGDVSSGCGVAVGVLGATAGREDLAAGGVVHGPDTAHGIVGSIASCRP